MCRKANYLLHTFSGCDMRVKTKLIVTHGLELLYSAKFLRGLIFRDFVG